MANCQCCGMHFATDLHHILRRSLYNDKSLEQFMPLCFYALLCNRCNMNNGPYTVDDPEGRAELLAQNALIFGMDKGLIAPELSIEQAFIAWSLIVPNGLNEEIVSLERVKEIYATKYAK